MSTYYKPRRPLKLDDVREIEEFDVVEDGNNWGFYRVELDPKTDEIEKEYFLSVETNSKGYVIDVYRHGSNNVMIYSLILKQNLVSRSFQKEK